MKFLIEAVVGIAGVLSLLSTPGVGSLPPSGPSHQGQQLIRRGWEGQTFSKVTYKYLDLGRGKHRAASAAAFLL